MLILGNKNIYGKTKDIFVNLDYSNYNIKKPDLVSFIDLAHKHGHNIEYSQDIRDLIKSSLRMRPDRVIVGEVRGIEVIDMIAAMSTGHDGSLSTGHSNSAKGMIRRLETMYLSDSNYPIDAVRGQISEALEFLIHLQRDNDGIISVFRFNVPIGINSWKIVFENESFKKLFSDIEKITFSFNKNKEGFLTLNIDAILESGFEQISFY